MSATAKKEKFVAHNWKNVPGSELKKMSLLQRARYLAYEEPSKEVVNSVLISKQRLRGRAPVSRNPQKNPDPEAEEQQRKQDTVIGQLRAAEARNRVRSMRVRYQSMRAQEINHLISCQPTAQKAVRLELLLPAKLEKISPGNDAVDKLELQEVAKKPLPQDIPYGLRCACGGSCACKADFNDLRKRIEEILEDERGLTINRT